MKTRVIQSRPGDEGAAAAAGPRPVPAPRRARRTGRIVGGAVAATIGVAALAGGGALVGVHATQRDGDGFYATDVAELTTPTRALVSHDIDVDLDGVAWLADDGRLADLRLSATAVASRDGPVFVGIGPRGAVEAYLRGVPRESADFGDAGGGGGAGAREPGTRAPAPPASQAFWTRSAQGEGRQTIVWPIDAGRWSAVVMNADGSPGVRVRTGLGARTDLVLWLGVGALVAGVALAGAGAALIASGRRRREEGVSP